MPAVEHKLCGLLGAWAQGQHCLVQGMATFLSVPRPIREAGGRGLCVHRADGCEPQCLGYMDPLGGFALFGVGKAAVGRLHQAGCLRAVGGQHHRVKACAVHVPAISGARQARHALPRVQRRSLGLQPLRSGIREQRTQVGARQQQVRATAPAEQAVAQHAQEHFRAGLVRRGVECRYAKGLDELLQQALRQAFAQLRYRPARIAPEALELPAGAGAQQRDFVGPTPAACPRHAHQRIPGGRQVGQFQAAAVGVGQGQGEAQHGAGHVHAHRAHQTQGFGVGTNQDVLPVVQHEGLARCIHGVQCPRPPTQGASGFHHRDVVACLRQRHGCRHAGPAGPHHRDAHHMRPRAWTFHASQNLRKGVRRMRWCSTWKLSCSISRSRVR